MEQAQGRAPRPDDTAAFQRFYAERPGEEAGSRGILYRLLIGWWRDEGLTPPVPEGAVAYQTCWE